jgi:hypothetical protein
MRLAVCAFVLACVAPARAAVESCAGAGDGTPCAGPCIVEGACKAGVCEAGMVRENGSPCASGDRCSLGDFCDDGVCLPGASTITCPSASKCRVGMCDPRLGCVLVDVCPAGLDPQPLDLESAEHDLAPVDPPMIQDFGVDASRPVADGGVDASGDASPPAPPPPNTAPDGGEAPPEVEIRGSNLAGCRCDLSGVLRGRALHEALLVPIVILLVRWRRRRG